MTNVNNEMDEIAVSTDKDVLTDLQVYGISGTVVKLLGELKKYIILTQIQRDLKIKPLQTQNLMREWYQFEEVKLITDIRTTFDMSYVYTKDKIVIQNFNILRDRFENAVHYLTTNMMEVKSVMDTNYDKILDEFQDKIKKLTDDISKKSIYEDLFNV